MKLFLIPSILVTRRIVYKYGKTEKRKNGETLLVWKFLRQISHEWLAPFRRRTLHLVIFTPYGDMKHQEYDPLTKSVI